MKKSLSLILGLLFVFVKTQFAFLQYGIMMILLLLPAAPLLWELQILLPESADIIKAVYTIPESITIICCMEELIYISPNLSSIHLPLRKTNPARTAFPTIIPILALKGIDKTILNAKPINPLCVTARIFFPSCSLPT